MSGHGGGVNKGQIHRQINTEKLKSGRFFSLMKQYLLLLEPRTSECLLWGKHILQGKG